MHYKLICMYALLIYYPLHAMRESPFKQLKLPFPEELCLEGVVVNSIERLRAGLSLGADINYGIHEGMPLLWLACKNATHEDIIAELLKQENINLMPCDTDAHRCHKKNFLHLAAETNKPIVVKLLLEKNEKLAYIRDKNGQLPIHIAAQHGNHHCLSALLAMPHNNIDCPDYAGNSPLHLACQANSFGCIKLLLDTGACTTVQNNLCATPLWNLWTHVQNDAFIDDDFYTIDYLKRTDAQQNNQLHLCATLQCVDDEQERIFEQYVSFLVSQGIDIKSKNSTGKTATDLASQAYNELTDLYRQEKLLYLPSAIKNQRCIKQILECQQCTEQQTFKQQELRIVCRVQTAKNEAQKIDHEPSFATATCFEGIFFNSIHIFKLGIWMGADVNYIDAASWPLLCRACAFTTNEEIITELLQQKNIDVTACNANKETALHIACSKNLPMVVKAIVQINPYTATTLDIRGHTPFDIALKYDHTQCIQSILTAHPHMATMSSDSKTTALHRMIKKGNIPCIELLLDACSTHINAQNEHGDTALHLATAFYGMERISKQSEIITLLLARGACPTIKNFRHETALCVLIRHFEKNKPDPLFKNLFTALEPHLELLMRSVDADNNNQLHLTATLQDAPDPWVQQYANLLISEGVSIHARNKDGKRAIDLACDMFEKLQSRYRACKLPRLKLCLDNQERLMHNLLRAVSPHTEYEAFTQLFAQHAIGNDVAAHIAHFYYALNIETIVAKKQKKCASYYKSFIENKDEIKQQLYAAPEPQLLWAV